MRSQVFISYSHKNRSWLERLQTMLRPLVRTGAVTVWDDMQIKPGQRWRDEITQALARARVAVLLVSPEFLASDFIHQHELPPLLDAAEQEGLKIIWVPISASLYTVTEIARYQSAWDPARPLDSLSDWERNQALVSICHAIKDAVAEVRPEKTDAARLQFVQGAPVSLTRVFARKEIVLGRPKLNADLWLALFPLNDTANQALMDGFSRFHAVLRFEHGAEIRDDHSRAGTDLDGTPLDRQWRPLTDGAVIDFAHHALRLQVRSAPACWLRLDRLDNGVEVENYLLLKGRAIIGTGATAAIPVSGQPGSTGALAELRYEEGGFVIAPVAAPLAINGGRERPGMAVGLRDGDRVEVGPLVFDFRTGAYPG